jgi:hypothetical protein
MTQELRVTIHAMERFVQRTRKQFRHIDDCLARGCQKCDRLKEIIRQEVFQHSAEISKELLIRFGRAKEYTPVRHTSLKGKTSRYFLLGEFEFIVDDSVEPAVLITFAKRHQETVWRKIAKNSRTGNRKEH